MKLFSLRRAVTAVLLVGAFFAQGTLALAGTTGNLSGVVSDAHGAPVAGAIVRVASPSQVVTLRTDASGHFSALSLAPDTYVVSVSKEGYQDTNLTGVSIFADQNQAVAITLNPMLTTIATVRSTAASNLVKAGTTASVYSVNANQAAQVASSGGGNNLDSALSAVYTVPGVSSYIGNYGGPEQTFYIRGAGYMQTGYEFDGVPINRSFDNYSGGSLSSLGNAEIQVYTGAPPSGSSTSTVGGFINQVIKTGTYPGYATANVGLGYPGFYHKLQFEAGGSTPNRSFTYYLGMHADNKDLRFINNDNGDNLSWDGSDKYGLWGCQLLCEYFGEGGGSPLMAMESGFFGGDTGRGPWATCGANGTPPSGAAYYNSYILDNYSGLGGLPGFDDSGAGAPMCITYGPISTANGIGAGGRGGYLTDRENIANFHFAIPHKNGTHDDLQLLFDNFAYHHVFTMGSIDSNGGMAYTASAYDDGFADFLNDGFGISGVPVNPNGYGGMPASAFAGWCGYQYLMYLEGYDLPCATSGPSPISYSDTIAFPTARYGAPLSALANASTPYLFPNTGTQRAPYYAISPNETADPDGTWENGTIIKAQYQKALGSNAYVRLFGYTFYSNWLQNAPNFYAEYFSAAFPNFTAGGEGQTAGDYYVASHTRGVQLQFVDQINEKNLINFTAGYTQATSNRYNNGQIGGNPSSSPVGLLYNSSNGTCYSARSNQGSTGPKYVLDGSYPQNLPVGSPVSCLSTLAMATFADADAGTYPAVPGGTGAEWIQAMNTVPNNNNSIVTPKFASFSLQDTWTPSDRLHVDASVRLDSFSFIGTQLGGSEANFWANIVNSDACIDPSGLAELTGTATNGSGLGTSVRQQSGQPGPSGVVASSPGKPGTPCTNFDGSPMLNLATGKPLVHPGMDGVPLFSISSGLGFTNVAGSGRIGFTYTLNPKTVIRGTYGHYVQPMQSAYVQQLSYQDGFGYVMKNFYSAYYGYGYANPVHSSLPITSNNADLTLEKQLNGTDISFSLTPYYRYTMNQEVGVTLPGNLAGGFNGATQKTKGVEFDLQMGDPTKNGLSGMVSYTYTDAKVKYAMIGGTNYIQKLWTGAEGTLPSYYALAGPDGAPCYDGGAAVADCSTDPAAVKNPYYHQAAQYASPEAFDEAVVGPVDGWYPYYANGPGVDADTAVSPNVFNGWLTFHHDKWTASVNAELYSGNLYGSPTDIGGIDPRYCAFNQGPDGSGLVGAGSSYAQDADYQSCSTTVNIPNPQTGSFAKIGQYKQPWQLNVGLQFNYQMSRRVSAQLMVANVVNRCFGGTKEPWTSAYPSNNIDCGYFANTTYIGNQPGAGFFEGASPHDSLNGTAGYPGVFNTSYAPEAGGIPLQAYFTVNFRL